jgi:hypothetical protein
VDLDGSGDGLSLVSPPWALLEIGAQQTLLRHFARSPLASAAPPDADAVWVVTGVASNIHNGVVATRLNAERNRLVRSVLGVDVTCRQQE